MTNFNLKSQKFLTEESIIERTQDFQIYFQRIPSEGLRPMQNDEEAFPLAFVHLIHGDVGIFEMSLAIMYRPQDYHCIQIDAKVRAGLSDRF